jgi:hypothetical protein
MTKDEKLISKLADALAWCSGSNDFGPKGIARKGWLKVAPLIEKANKRLNSANVTAIGLHKSRQVR